MFSVANVDSRLYQVYQYIWTALFPRLAAGSLLWEGVAKYRTAEAVAARCLIENAQAQNMSAVVTNVVVAVRWLALSSTKGRRGCRLRERDDRFRTWQI